VGIRFDSFAEGDQNLLKKLVFTAFLLDVSIKGIVGEKPVSSLVVSVGKALNEMFITLSG